MNTPEFPLLFIGKNGELDLTGQPYSRAPVSVLLFPREPLRASYYDRNGGCWNCRLQSNRLKDSFLTRLLARTVYNPMVPAIPVWNRTGSYTLPELKSAIAGCIDQDDDVLTQFVDGETIKSAIQAAATFDDIVAVLRKYVFEADEETLRREIDNQY